MKRKEDKPGNRFNILLGITGGIAAYKSCELTRLFVKSGHTVKVILTRHGRKFVTPLTMETLSCNQVYTDLFGKKSFSTEHISLSKWADALLVAPATANIMGKFANGIADDILSTVFLSFRGPVVVAPAMHTEMYRHPAVMQNMTKLLSMGVSFVEPASGMLASGDVGEGRLADPSAIFEFTASLLSKKKDLEGKKVVITAGPTREYIDPVRFISSPSTGKMGLALAEEAISRGASVTFIHGPLNDTPRLSCKTVSVGSASEMNRAVICHKNCDIFISTAAVSDYRPREFHPEKIKKNGESLTLELVPNPDILGNFSQKYGRSKIVVGFAAETENLEKNASDKLRKKKLDLIVANDVSAAGSGFASDNNKVVLIDSKGRIERLPLLPKATVAGIIFDRISKLKRQ